MKTKTEKQFDAVKFMREQRDQISDKLSKMSNKEILDYFQSKTAQSKLKPRA